MTSTATSTPPLRRRPWARGPEPITWEELVHLVWLSFLVFQPLFDPTATAASWGFVALAVVLFLPVYFWTWTQSGARSLPGIVVLTLLGVAGAPFNTGTASFLIYAAAVAGTKLPTRMATRTIGGLIVAVAVAAATSGVPWPFALSAFLPVIFFVPLVGAMNVFYAARRQSDARLRRAHDEIERVAAIAERERIARDLHDLLGHTLSVIVLKSELASKLSATQPERAADEIRDVERISRRALTEVREAVVSYRRRGLPAEVEEARDAFAAARVELTVDLPDRLPPPRVEGVLALVLREALTNVVRHARASICRVRLAEEGAAWVLEVVDDGQGRLEHEGNGLTGIRERVEGLGGSVDVVGGRGVRLVARVPAGAPA